MKFYPYSNIQSTNLKSLLISVRILGFMSYLLFFGAVLVIAFGVLSGTSEPVALGNGINATMTMHSPTGPAIITGIWGLVSSICLLAFSGLCAAVVSCENKFTSKAE